MRERERDEKNKDDDDDCEAVSQGDLCLVEILPKIYSLSCGKIFPEMRLSLR